MDLTHNSETEELALRFLNVMGYLFKVAQHRMPDHVVGQLHLNQLHMLHMLEHHPGLSQKDIAERLQITPPAVSTAVRDMETLGLVQRQPGPTDARQMHLYLCPIGKEIVSEAKKMRQAAIANLLSVLPIEEQRQIVEMLERALKLKENPS